MVRIRKHLSNRKGCHHADVVGVTIIEEEEIALCVDCDRVVNNKTGRLVGRDMALMWIARNEQEAENYNLKEVYKIK